MKKNYIARRRGTSVAAAALSFALVAPFAQPVAFAQDAGQPGGVSEQPVNEPEYEGVQEEDELPDGVGDGDLEDPTPSDDPNEGLGETVESPRPADVPTQRGGVEVVWADAIDNGYIRTATGLTNAQSTLSGRAYEFSATGNVRPTANGQRAVPEGTTVYMQWVDNDGAVSPIYATKTRAAIGTDGGQGGPGVYAFDLRTPWYDANGKEHVFRARGGSATQQYRLWIDDYVREAEDTKKQTRYTAMTQKNGFFPGSYVGTATSRNNGAFPLLGQNMQRTAVFMQAEPEDKVAALTRPRDEWIDATALRDDKGNPLGVETKIGRVNLATVANPTSDTINGSVWLETGAGEGGNFQTGPGRNYNSGDVPAQGYTVVLSQLSPAGYQRYKDEVRTKPEQERNEFSLQWLRDNGNSVIEATYYTKTDRHGNYSIQMPNRLPTTVKPLDNIWMTVLDPKAEEKGELKELAAFSPWMLPQFHNATALGTRAANSYWPNHAAEGPVTSVTKRAHRNYSFAVIPDYQVNLDIENFNVTDKPATVGEGQIAQLKASGVVPNLPTHIEWRVGDSVIKGGSNECPVTGVQDLGECATLDVDAEYEIDGETRKLRDGEVVRAVMVTGTQHTNDIASDAFVIRDTDGELDANEYELVYPESSATAGEETTIPAPKQPNGEPFPVDESDPDNPKPTRFTQVLDPNFPVVDADGKPAEFPGEITVNPDGTITVVPNEDATPGDEFKIPVIVRYPDDSAETIYADVKIVPNYDPAYPGEFTPKTTDQAKNKGEGTIAPAGETVTATPEFETTAPADDVTVTYKRAEGFTAPAGYTVTVDEATGEVTFEVADVEQAKATPVVEVPVEVTYSDGSATDEATAVFYLDTDKDGTPDVDDAEPENPNVPAPKQNTEFDPQYNGGNPTEVKQGETKTITPANKDKDKDLPEGTTFAPVGELPEWIEVGDDGKITVAPNDEEAPGEHTITVEVTYPDGSKDTIETTIKVTKVTPADDQTGGTGGNDDQNTGKTNVSVGEDGIQTVKPTDDEQGTGIIIKNNGDDTKITVKDEDKKDIPYTIDPETGEIKVTPGTDVDGPIIVTVEDDDLPGGQTQFEVPVEGHTKGQDDNGKNGPTGNETSVGVGEDGIQTVKPTDDEQGTGIIIKNNGDDTKITVKDEDKKDIPYTIDPETGEIKVTPGTDVDGPIIITVEDADLPGGKAVFEVPVKDKDGNEHKFRVDDNAASYGDRTEVKPGGKRDSKRPVADSVKIEKAELNEADREKGGWRFAVDSKTGIVTAAAPNTGKLQELFDNEFLNNAPVDWNDFVNRFKNTGQPDVEVALSFEGDRDGENAVAGFDLVGKDGRSIFDKDGDFDGDGTSNYDELFKSGIDWSKTTPKPFGPTDNTNNPSSMSDEDWAKCKVGLGIGVPLIGLLPLGLLLAAGLPALEPVARDFSKQIEDANAALQRQIGIFNPESAAQVKQINDQLKEFGLNLVTGGALLILVPLVIGGIAAIADNCAPGGQALSAERSSNRD